MHEILHLTRTLQDYAHPVHILLAFKLQSHHCNTDYLIPMFWMVLCPCLCPFYLLWNHLDFISKAYLPYICHSNWVSHIDKHSYSFESDDIRLPIMFQGALNDPIYVFGVDPLFYLYIQNQDGSWSRKNIGSFGFIHHWKILSVYTIVTWLWDIILVIRWVWFKYIDISID